MSASTSPNAPSSLKGGIDGDEYTVTPEMIAAFERDGYVHIPGVLTEAEMAEVEEPMMRFIKGEVLPEGKDLCDMSGAVDRTPDEYTVFNAMLPRRYLPSMQGNVFEVRAASIARQLTRGKDMSIDYDQLLAKRPGSPDSIFAWHQDLAYWPPLEKDPATATCWLAIDDSNVANGCMRFLPGSNKESTLRKHAPVRISKGRMDEESSHALATTLAALATTPRPNPTSPRPGAPRAGHPRRARGAPPSTRSTPARRSRCAGPRRGRLAPASRIWATRAS